MLQAVIKKISEQQKACEGKPAWCVGEHLKDILRDNPDCAEIVLQDLNVKEMSIIECEKKIKAYADKHKQGNVGFCPPHEAEKIIKKFYGISSEDGNPGQANNTGFIDLTSFL